MISEQEMAKYRTDGSKDLVELFIRRAKAKATENLSPSRETSLVLTKLDEALLWLTLSSGKDQKE